MKIHQLTERIRLYEYFDIERLFGVSHLIGVIEEPDAIYLIDSGLGPDQVKPIIETTAKPVHLILTHSHWDHVWGASAITGRIYAQENWEDSVSERDLKRFKRYHRGDIELVTPTDTFRDYLKVGNLELFATPGHSRDGLAIWDPIDQALFIGDLPFIDHRIPELKAEHVASLQACLSYPFRYLIPAHRGLITREKLAAVIAQLEAK